MTERTNVVIVCLDSVRKDFFDRYAQRIRTRSEVSLERCRAVSSWSTPSHASMISGQLPSEHGIHTHNRHFETLPVEETLFGDLEEYEKLAVSSNTFAGPAFGFDDYFDEFDVATSTRRFRGLNPERYLGGSELTDPSLFVTYLVESLRSDHPLGSLFNAGIGGINLITDPSSVVPKFFDKGTKPVLRRSKKQIDQAAEPFVAFCNVMEAHIPHKPIRGYDGSFYPDVPNDWSTDVYSTWELCEREASDYWSKREQLYAAVTDYLDRNVAKYVSDVRDVTENETTFVITSDHGDNHGRKEEDGMANHVSSLSEGVLHVPLEIVNPPPEMTAALHRIEHEPFSHRQLREVVTALADRSTTTRFEPDEVLPAELVGRAESVEPPSREDYWDRAQRCCTRNGRKVLWDSRGRVVEYDLDPNRASWRSAGSELDVVPDWAIDQFPTEIAEFKARARRTGRAVELDQATESRLQNLGYLD